MIEIRLIEVLLGLNTGTLLLLGFFVRKWMSQIEHGQNNNAQATQKIELLLVKGLSESEKQIIERRLKCGDEFASQKDMDSAFKAIRGLSAAGAKL